jgi:hypothetical protein
MTKMSKDIQTSTLDTMPMSPPIGGRGVPPGFKQYKGTKEAEIETLKVVFRQDGSNPYKDDAYNINGFDRFKPGGKFNETNYHTYIVSLYDNSDMEVRDRYVAIADMMKHMINSQHIYVSTTRNRYMYSPALLEYLHQVPQVEVEVEEDEYNFGTRGKEIEDKTAEKWNIVEKERKDRDRRSKAREQVKQRLTTMKDPPNQPKNYPTFESDDEDDEKKEDEKMVEQKVIENIAIEDVTDDVIEDIVIETDTSDAEDAISRLEVQELEYIQAQEETKSEILGPEETLEEMMERKLTERFERMDAEWEHKASNEAIKITSQADKITSQADTITKQHDRIAKLEIRVCKKAVEIKELKEKLDTTIELLDMKLTIAADRIKEVDQATEGMANFLDASKAQQMESMHKANGIAGSIKRARQKLIETQNQVQPTTLDIKDAKEAIHREGKLVGGEIRKERDRILKNITDRDQSSRDELQRRTNRSIDRITGTGNDTMDNMDITAASAIDKAESIVDTVINGTDFRGTLRQRIDAYIESYPPTMEHTMYKFTEQYFKNNEQLDNYIRDIAGSTIGTDQLNREVQKAATAWMDKNMREDNQASYEASDGDKSRDDREEEDEDEKYKGDKYEGGRPPLFTDAKWRHTEEEKNRIEREDRAQAITRTTHIAKAIQRFETKPMHSHCIPAKGIIDMDKARHLYHTMYDDSVIETLPITNIDDLISTQSCIPIEHNEADATIEAMTHAIMRRLQILIPVTNVEMLDILGPFLNDRDGYGALYAIMRRTCAFMKPTTQGWGPEWKPTMSPSKYVTTLQSAVTNHAMTHNTKYNNIQQSQEMLHQALQSYNTPISTKLTGELNHWINANPTRVKTGDLPNNWKITGLADQFADYHTTTSTPNRSINIFDGKKQEGGKHQEGGGYAKEKRFSLRNKKQCGCCKMAGHNIGDQICRVGAQMAHVTKFATANKETYESNADKYYKSNRPVLINRVMRAYPDHNTEEEIMDECENWINNDEKDDEQE